MVLKLLGLPTDLFKNLMQRTETEVAVDRLSKLSNTDDSPRNRPTLCVADDGMRGKSSTIQLLMAR
jgi:hypothetical protein